MESFHGKEIFNTFREIKLFCCFSSGDFERFLQEFYAFADGYLTPATSATSAVAVFPSYAILRYKMIQYGIFNRF